MSIINKMLQELDKRHAPITVEHVPAAAAGAVLTQHLRPVQSGRRFSELFWRVMGALILISIGWVAWLMWQLTPRSAVTELAYQSLERARGGAPATAAKPATPALPAAAAVAVLPVPAVAVVPAPAVLPLVPVVAGAPQLPADRAAQQAPQRPAAEPRNPDMLRLATELTTPIPERRFKPVPPPKETPEPEPHQAAAQPRLPVQMPAPSLKSEMALPQPRAAAVAADSGKIDRRANVTPRERAESEYRRAVNLVNQGRMAEGMDGFRAALQADPGYEAPRQTLVALLLEANRVDEAASILREGLATNPANAAFAALLARIMVERGDLAGALALLQKHAPAAGSSAEYHGFAAALYQRLGRHKEAIEEYQTALRLAPSAGVWWVGLAISQQAAERPRDALDSFRRAKATGSLAPDLVTFVDQRLKQLQ